jgi:RNA polymerase sigma factor (sigma-70 family)
MPSPSLTLLRAQSDERLVELAAGGHERAFEAIVERYRKPLLRAARRVLPEGRAEDALQQALLAAWTALQRGDEVRDVRPWLYRIVHNTSLNALRMSGYDYAELHEAARITNAGEDELERRAVVRQTLASLAALPDRQREALIRTAISGDSQEAVARDLGLSDNALRQLVHRARMSMRAAVTALTPMPLVTAAASGSPRGDALVDRIAELVTGGGGAATLAKAGTVAVLAGSAISGPAIVHQVSDRRGPAPVVAAAAPPKHEKKHRPATAEPARAAATPVAVRKISISLPSRPASARTTRPSHPRRRVSGSSGSGSEDIRDDDSGHGELSHSGSGDDGADDNVSTGSGRQRSGDDGTQEDRSGPSGSSGDDTPSTPIATVTPPSGSGDDEHDYSGTGSSGGSDHEAEPTPTPTPLATPNED